MRKLKEVLRLSSLGLKQQQIARSCRIAQSTVHGYLKAAAAAGIRWPLPSDWDDRRLEAVICGTARPTKTWRKTDLPDFATIRQELQTHHNLTLQLVWEEYREQHPDGYRYSRFGQLYREWEKRLDVVLRQEYRAGELRRVTEIQLSELIAGLVVEERPPGVLTGSRSDRSHFQILDCLNREDLRRVGRNWVTQCPSCAAAGRDRGKDNLAISVEEPSKYLCWAGCTNIQIRAALGAPAPANAR